MAKICYWDEQERCQKDRDATPEEQQEIDSRKPSIDEVNRPILDELRRIDAKSIRSLREGDMNRVSSLEAEAQELRNQLMKE